MRSIFKPLMFCLLLLFAGSNSKAQEIESLQNTFKQYNDQVLQEKIYVHTDKNFYLTGEILWFKLYNVDAGSIIPLNISKVAYVDVLDEANNPVLQAKIALNNGAGAGSFYVPVTFKNGNYKLRAYTNWMKNFSPDVFFEKVITVVNPLTEPVTIAKTAAESNSIQFFAEGGNLVAGVSSTVAFKATDADGRGMDINGVVINQRNDTVARFRSLKFGMGSFLFTPEANSTYKSVVRIGRDKALISELPSVSLSGYGVHLTNTDNKYELKISERGETETLYLIIHSGQQVIQAQRIILDANSNATVTIDKAKLGKGINHITLFNSTRQPVAERLIFNRPELLNLRGQAQLQYKIRSQVSIPVSAQSNTRIPVSANMSVAVFKLDSLINGDDADIASYLWLSSELKGNIEYPHYYFDVITAETDKALDNLLLVHGWSRFKWADVLNNKQNFTYLPEYDGHLITGNITTSAGLPAKGVTTYLGVSGKRVQLYASIADTVGHLLFNTKQLYGPGEIVVQTNTEQDSAFRITIANPFAEKYTSTPTPALRLNNQWKNTLENTSLNMQVQNIFIPNKLKQYANPMVDSTAFYGNLHKTYLLDDFVRFTTMEEVLREYIAEITVTIRQKRVIMNVLSTTQVIPNKNPLVMLDGVHIFNVDRILAIDPLKIRKLDMLNQAFFWGPIDANGVISMTSYKGDMAGFEIDPRAVVLDYEGMQLQREFYSPVYETEQQQKSRLPDFRNVLYWAPDINTDAQGKANVTFYTSDKPGKYIAVFQGLTKGGQAGSYKLYFDVVK